MQHPARLAQHRRRRGKTKVHGLQQQLGTLSLSATDELLAAIFHDADERGPFAGSRAAPSPSRAIAAWPALDMGAPSLRAAAPSARRGSDAGLRAPSLAIIDVRGRPCPVAARRLAAASANRRSRARSGVLAALVVGALALGWNAGSGLYAWLASRPPALTDSAAVRDLVDRIIRAESNGDPNARNPRSTAAGAAQFLDGTWLELVRTHRPDLRQLTAKETLDLRQNIALAREMTARFAEKNATMLSARGLPITAGTLYLAHFAGGAGAVALLTAADDASAAGIMAQADATGRATREKIVQANPFLESFTVADIKRWAERKVRKAAAISDRTAHGKAAGQRL